MPAYFNDHQRKATIDAGRLAGLKVDRLVNEPTAAALAYGLADEAEGKFLIFDLGGGTFDVSILDKYEGVMEIRATTGDTRLGGDDFTAVIEAMIAKTAGLDVKALGPEDRARLNRAAETLKVNLSAAHEAPYAVQLGKVTREGSITRQAYELECAGLLRRLRGPTERALVDAQMSPADFDAVVLVGGATRSPMVRSLVGRLFQKLPLINIDPDTTVALGAAIQAGLVGRDAGLEDVVMTDVSPYTLGVATIDTAIPGERSLYVTPIIQRNAIVPISRTLSLTTVKDNQKIVNVAIYQGENLRPESNVHLGSIDVPVPPKPEGEESIEVRFTYDINGALEVEVLVVSTQSRLSKIFRNTSGLSEDELAARFKALGDIKLLPRDQIENKTLLARAERLYSEQGQTQPRDPAPSHAPVRKRDRRPDAPRRAGAAGTVRRIPRHVRNLAVRQRLGTRAGIRAAIRRSGGSERGHERLSLVGIGPRRAGDGKGDPQRLCTPSQDRAARHRRQGLPESSKRAATRWSWRGRARRMHCSKPSRTRGSKRRCRSRISQAKIRATPTSRPPAGTSRIQRRPSSSRQTAGRRPCRPSRSTSRSPCRSSPSQ